MCFQRVASRPAPTSTAHGVLALTTDGFTEAAMLINHLLRQAEMAVKYVENEVRYGAPNKAEHIYRVEAAAKTSIWPVDAPRDRSMMDARMNLPLIRSLMGGPVATSVTRMRQLSNLTKTAGVGTCVGMAAVAFDYLHEQRVGGIAVLGLEQCDHVLVVLGLQREPLEVEAVPPHGLPVTWSPHAVVCDPWYHEWFVVSEWHRKVPHIIRLTRRSKGLADTTPPAIVQVKRLAYAA